MAKGDRYRFRQQDTIGANDAENDEYLRDCFVDTGAASVIRDVGNPKCLLVGRTGSGKTALLAHLAQMEEHVICIEPESLSLSYVSNSDILKFFTDIGVRLDLFFKLLWRHVLTVEIFKDLYNIDTEADKRSFIDRIKKKVFRKTKHDRAIEYLQEWGGSFWEDTEYRIKEVTTALETKLDAELSAKINGLGMGAGATEHLTQEIRGELLKRGQSVVSGTQVQILNDLLELLADILDDSQKRYYLAIDRLDDEWVDSRLRLRLIRALIDTVRDFRRVVPHLKIVVALRLDLLDAVFKATRDAGQQEEKYESLQLRLSWTKAQLIEVLERRINRLMKRSYTGAPIRWDEIWPRKIPQSRSSGIDYLIERTLYRPRDIIMYLNSCIQMAANKPTITAETVRKAEGEYSRARLRSLAEEWYLRYPNLMVVAGVLKRKRAAMALKDLEEEFAGFCLECCVERPLEDDSLGTFVKAVAEGRMSSRDGLREVALVFYEIGLIELKAGARSPFMTTLHGGKALSSAEIEDDARLRIHPAFWRVLGVRDAVPEEQQRDNTP